MIYFLQRPDGGPIKIGTTIRLSERLRQLTKETGGELCVLAVAEGSFLEEQSLHDRFSHLRVVNEWFEPGGDLIGFIAVEGRPWDGSDEVPEQHQVRIDSDLAAKAKYLATRDGIPLAEFLSDLLRPAIDREFRKAGRDLLEGGD